MNSIIKECAEKNGLEKSAVKRVVGYHHYSGKNWLNGDPLQKDTQSKEKDKVSPVFIKLVQIVEDLAALGDKDFLEPYLKAVLNKGIKIEIDYGTANLNESADDILDQIASASKKMTNVDTLAETLKETNAVKAEEIGFTPKKNFMNVLGVFEKIKNDKDVEDAVQEGVANSLMLADAYQYLATQIPHGDDEE